MALREDHVGSGESVRELDEKVGEGGKVVTATKFKEGNKIIFFLLGLRFPGSARLSSWYSYF